MFCSQQQQQQNDDSPSLFDQTVRDTDEEFYATFPAARDAQFSPANNSHHHYYYQPTYPAITQSSFNPVSPSEPRLDQIFSPDTPIVPILGKRKLRRDLRCPTPELTNGCEVGVMRLDDFSESLSSRESDSQISCFYTNQRRRALTWDSTRSSLRLSVLPSKRRMEKKPPLACLFCRGRKIACGPPLPGSLNKTCNQCQRRSLRCEYPSESRRGMRKKRTCAVAEASAEDN